MSQSAVYDALTAAAATLPKASPELLDRRRLLRRKDSKFVVPASALSGLIEQLSDDYSVVMAGESLIGRYETLYFDTPALRCFHDHRRGRRARHKVRIRHYPDRSVSFLEVKTKRSVAFSSKVRQSIAYGDSELSAEGRAFVDASCPLGAGDLYEQAWTNFDRLMLVHRHYMERLTIDCNLQLRCDGAEQSLHEIGVVEVKQSPFCVRTPVMQLLRKSGIRPASMSKYMTALALSDRKLRDNRLRPMLRKLEKARKR